MYRKIMVPLDGSQLAECVFPHLSMFINGFSPDQVLLVRVVEPINISSAIQATAMEVMKKNEAERVLNAEAYLQEMSTRVAGGEVKTEVLVGNISESLIDFALSRSVDLILIATHGRSGISRWVRGSVAERILHSASAPIVMVRASEGIA